MYVVAAGSCDAATGALLVTAPDVAVGLMGIAARPEDAVYLRFVGVFVAAVGLAYGYPFLLPPSGRRLVALVTVLEVTAGIRLLVAAFVLVAWASRGLETAWLSVALTDGALGSFQLWLTRLRRVGDEG